MKKEALILKNQRNPRWRYIFWGGLLFFILLLIFSIILRSCEKDNIACIDNSETTSPRPDAVFNDGDDDNDKDTTYFSDRGRESWRIDTVAFDEWENDDKWNRRRRYRGRYPVSPPDIGPGVPIDTSDIIIKPYPGLPITRPIVSNRLILYCQDKIDLLDFSDTLLLTYEDIEIIDWRNRYKKIQLKVPPNKLFSYKADLRSRFDDELKYVMEEVIIEHPFSSSLGKKDNGCGAADCEDKKFWHKDFLKYEDVASKYPADSTVTIAVIDESFQPNHPAIEGSIIDPWNIPQYSDSVDFEASQCHGTHVAGLAGGADCFSHGVKLMPLQIVDSDGLMARSYIIDAIFYSITERAEVINISLGLMNVPGGSLSDTSYFEEEMAMWDDIFGIARDSGCIVVQAAGNSSTFASLDPMKRRKNSIIVGSHDSDGYPSDFTNFGPSVEIYAPGSCIYSSVPIDDYVVYDGTSMASPIVAAAVAIKCLHNPGITFEEVREALIFSSKSVGSIQQLDLLEFLSFTPSTS